MSIKFIINSFVFAGSLAVAKLSSNPAQAQNIEVLNFGIIPQVIPLWTSFTLYRFESNVRSASVLGIVGAGGIGVSLYQSFESFDYGKVCTILIILILVTTIIDSISAKLRNWLL